MTEDKERPIKVSRRDFVKGAALGAGLLGGAGALASCGTAAAPTAPGIPASWDKEADVVIVGGGGTGIVAAIEAAEAGASVLVLEKAAVAGGTTSLSGAVIQACCTEYQRAAGVTDDSTEKHYEYWMTAAEGQADPELVRVLADNAPGNIQWLVDHGVEYAGVYPVDPIPTVPEELMRPRIHIPGPPGSQPAAGAGEKYHISILYPAAQEAGAEFMLETQVTGLVRDPDNGVIGVRAESGGEEMYVKANKGVILATSSFDHNEEMARAFSLQQLWAQETGLVATVPTDTGDGIKMAMEIGADLAGMGGTIGVPSPGIGGAAAPGIWVNQYGQRFVNEAAHYAFASRAVFNQVEHTAWAIFDEKVKEQGGGALGWSEDLSEEIASGVVQTGATLTALAEAIGVNGAELEATVEKWNEDVDGGEDTLFGKTAGLQTIDEGPYYAARMSEWNLGSHGGVRINTDARVLDVHGEVIPRLYAGGMVAGGLVGPYYPGSGTAVGTTVCFGRISGANASAEEPWG
jgi:urocanate reductase